MPQEILPPPNTSSVPDRATRKAFKDFTGDDADNRVLRINLGFLKYGTDDKAHAAAIVLSLALFLTIVGVMIFGDGGEWAKEVFRWVGGAFLFTAGVAIGKGGAKSEDDED